MPDKTAFWGALAQLWSWRPTWLLPALSLLAGGVPATHYIAMRGHFVPDGLEIETDGASGQIMHGVYNLDLPVKVYNGTQRYVLGVSFWVKAYVCADATSTLARCRRIASFAQQTPMALPPGDAASFTRSFHGGLPANTRGAVVRIIRELDSVVDDSYLEDAQISPFREDAPLEGKVPTRQDVGL